MFNSEIMCPVIKITDVLEIVEEQLTTTEAEIRAKAIDEFAEKLKSELLEEIQDISERQRLYEVGSDISTTYSHIMGTLRDVCNRTIGTVAEQLKEE